jgi:hypothetical protein
MGKRFEDAAFGAQYMVTKGGEGELSCIEAAPGEANALGKRYTDEATGITVLCTKAGGARVCCNGVPMEPLAAKSLPSSD